MVVGGTTPSTSNPSFWGGDLCWISPAELHGEKYLYDSVKKITKEAVVSKSLKQLPVGTVILSSRAPIGKVTINKVPMYCNQGFKCVICGPELYNEYLYYWFWGNTSFLNSLGTGATFPEISKTVVENIIIPVPPMEEQERIVARLDAAFAQIDELRANAEKQLEEARALFNAALTQAMTPKPGWQESFFGDCCEYYKEQGNFKNIKYIGLEHIESATGKLLGSISSNSVLSSSFKFSKGDVLYGRLRPYLRKVYIAEFDGCCSTEIFPIRSNSVEHGFIKYWFLTDDISNKINATSAGCRMPRGNMNEVKKFKFFYPKDKKEQQTIVERLDGLSERVKELEEIARTTVNECDALKQSILRETFE